LVRQSSLKKLEARAFAARRAAGGVGIVWSRDDVRVKRELEPGELVAVDMHRIGSVGVGVDQTWCVRVVERVTLEEEDLGWVYDAAGVVVGRVTESDGSMLTWRPETAAPVGGSGARAPV
jgi:hypothetical protein